MKNRLIAFLLTLALTCALAGSALALEYPPENCRTFQQYLNFFHSCEDEDTQALAAYIEQRLAEGLLENFDADAYLSSVWLGITKEKWFAHGGPDYGEDQFRADMLLHYLIEEYRAWQYTNSAAALAERWPEEYASFDTEAWFAGCHGISGFTQESYMTRTHLHDEESFRLHMFAQWAGQTHGFYSGYCVMVDGVPIQFALYQDLDGCTVEPYAENGRILIPVRAAAEALGLTVEYLPETNRVTCTGETGRVWFVLDSTDYSGGTLDAAPHAEYGVTYLPLRALGEALGCTVTWNQEFSTAALTRAS